MALLQLTSLPNTCINTLPLQRKSLFRPTKKAIPCRASSLNNVSANSQTVSRRSANFQPSIWNYDCIQSLTSKYMEESYKEQSKILKEEVKMMLRKVVNELDQLELIDVLQRLGVAYHFNSEIRNILDSVYNMDNSKWKNNLYATALKFRLLRQHRYDISADIFLGFKDEMGNFKKCEVKGILSVYEASFHSFENETILDEAKDLTSEFLKEYLINNEYNHLSLLISHALELPLHWRISRWEAQWFINVYERTENMSAAILQFAKLDFNILQTIYLEELKYTSRWWKQIGLAEKLDFSRDRLVENFIWTVGTHFEPSFGKYRRVMTKYASLLVIIDDTYDVHGTLEELELFTKSIDKWDLNGMENLPDYMKICFLALFNFVNEFTYETLKDNGYYITPYLKKAWADLCKAYLTEAKWYYSGYMPSLEKYMENAWISISQPAIFTHAYFLIPYSLRKEDLVYLEEYSDLVRFSSIILRLANDLGTYKRESEAGDVPTSIQCYMNETGATEAEACEYIKSLIFTTWKKLNEEARNSSLPQSFIDTALNPARMALCMYQHGDGHTIQDSEIKSHILSSIFQPIPFEM